MYLSSNFHAFGGSFTVNCSTFISDSIIAFLPADGAVKREEIKKRLTKFILI